MINKINVMDVIIESDKDYNIDARFFTSGVLSIGAIGLLMQIFAYRTTDLNYIKNMCAESMDDLVEWMEEINRNIELSKLPMRKTISDSHRTL
ncbi:MAG: hypothetical protein ACRC1P_09955 [Cellulosilyticaceae bacterium]